MYTSQILIPTCQTLFFFSLLMLYIFQLKSVKLVKAYFDRVIEVNPHIHAVVQDRFQKALEEAVRADELIARTPDAELPALFNRLKLLGVPFTVKESCGLKGT